MESQNFANTSPWIELRSVLNAGIGNRLARLRLLASSWCEDARVLLRGARDMLAAHSLTVAHFIMAGVALVTWMMAHDLEWLAIIRDHGSLKDHERLSAAARFLSYWGDFAGFNMLVFGTLCCFAFVRRSTFFRRMTIAAVLATCLTGGVANLVRVSAGRVRPGSHLTPGFYGPSLSAKKQSFPSAHTATSFGASVPVAVAFPPVGVPMLVVSGAVAWSRMENNCHHPSDVVASVLLSCLIGIPFGLVIRRRHRLSL
jgi:membrane-associated phospholipid phosphatase